MATIKFDGETFVNLACRTDLGEGYVRLGFDDLESDGADLITFVGLIQEDFIPEDGQESINYDELLLIKLDEGGIIDRFYGPGLYSKEGQLVLKVGNNLFSVKQASGKLGNFHCGKLQGELKLADANDITTKDAEGKDIAYEYYAGSIEFMNPNDVSDDPDIYVVKVKWIIDPAKPFKPGVVKRDVAQLAPIAHLLETPPTGGGGNYVNVQELGKGRFRVLKIEEVETKKGLRDVLILESGEKAWPRGLVQKQIEAAWSTFPCYLDITKIEQKGGKWYVNCCLRPIKADEPKKDKELVAAGAGFDDTPF